MRSILIIILVSGFVYGSSYFKFMEPYTIKEMSVPLGYYVLFLKWWNIKFEYFTYGRKRNIIIKANFPESIFPWKLKEHYISFSENGISGHFNN